MAVAGVKSEVGDIIGVSYGLSQTPESQVVSNAVLKIFAASSWADDGATAHAALNRWIVVANCDPAVYAYVDFVASGAARSGAVSSTDFMIPIAPSSYEPIFVPAGYELVIIRASSATTKCKAVEYLVG